MRKYSAATENDVFRPPIGRTQFELSWPMGLGVSAGTLNPHFAETDNSLEAVARLAQ